jgi:glycosyltransferase involved in cell wall biosynthesis
MFRISVITVNRNNSKGLEKTITSVITQSYRNVEYIIIDGASTDNSIEIIKRFESKIYYWISEKDDGIYNAMNKGIAKATGEYLLFLNSGDYLQSPESLSILTDNIQEEGLIYGNIVVKDQASEWIKKYPAELTFSYFLEDTLPHPATLIKRSLLEKDGFNDNLKIVSDWEFFICTICKYSKKYKYVDGTISVFNLDGISSKPESHALIHAEKSAVLKKHFSSFLSDYEHYFRLINDTQNLLKSSSYKLFTKVKNNPVLKSLSKLKR